jgi:hypothetical protein
LTVFVQVDLSVYWSNTSTILYIFPAMWYNPFGKRYDVFG